MQRSGQEKSVADSHRVAIYRIKGDLENAIRMSLEQIGILSILEPTTVISIKPNLTYPYHVAGVTTSPEVIRKTIKILREYTSHIAIVETDGGYGAWRADEAFKGHGLDRMRQEFGIEIVNLNIEPSEMLTFYSGRKEYTVPLPTRLMHGTDIFITMPVPKIHCMTGLTLGYKNQWGCIPDSMRLRRHYLFNDAIVAINKALGPVVLADGTFFLDRNGPMAGDPIRMDLIMAASDPGAFDRYVSELMGISWKEIPHLRKAAKLGDMVMDLNEIKFNVDPRDLITHTFRLRRTLRNYLALLGFRSRFVTWLGYESWFGKTILHGLLYALVGRPVKPQNSGSVTK